MRRRRGTAARLADRDELFLTIQAVLEEDRRDGGGLMLKKYRDQRDETLGGYCTIATETYFYLQEGEDLDPRAGGGLQPMMRRYEDTGGHWWLVRKSDGAIIDLTIRPGEASDAANYEGEGVRRSGFMMHGYREPSKRAKALIARVQARRAATCDS
jgi:hypothetical protein